MWFVSFQAAHTAVPLFWSNSKKLMLMFKLIFRGVVGNINLSIKLYLFREWVFMIFSCCWSISAVDMWWLALCKVTPAALHRAYSGSDQIWKTHCTPKCAFVLAAQMFDVHCTGWWMCRVCMHIILLKEEKAQTQFVTSQISGNP